MDGKKPSIKKRYIFITLAVVILFGSTAISWLLQTPFEETGEIVNAIFMVLVILVVPLILLVAALKGKLQTPKEQFLTRGFIANTTLSRSKPDLLPTLLFISMMILIGSIAVGVLIDLAGSWIETGEFPFWALLGLFPFLLYLTLFFYLLARFWVNRRIARIMAGVSLDKPEVPKGKVLLKVSVPGDCSIITALPGRPKHRQILTPQKNAMGATPLRVLYLWNFDVGYPNREIKSWRRYGPVYWLWSPNNVPATQYLSLAMKRNTADFFASTITDVSHWLHQSNETPDSPLIGKRRFPDHSITCVADIWQVAVTNACEHADAIILDARGFNRERRGLAWELNHVVQQVPVERFLIIADITTDLGELVSTVHTSAGQHASAPLARIVYPPLLKDREEISRLFDKQKLPTLNYEAPNLVHLFVES